MRYFVISLLLFLVTSYSYADQKLIRLTQAGDVSKVESLLKSRFVKLESRASNGDTPLLIAARAKNFQMFDMLVKYGANINVLAKNDRDILNLSVRISSPKLARRALQAGISTHTFTPSYQGSALIFASAEGEVEIVKAILQKGGPINRRNNLGWTALQEAVMLGDGTQPFQDIVKLLLKAGADKTILDKHGKTPLENARKRKQGHIVRLLSD